MTNSSLGAHLAFGCRPDRAMTATVGPSPVPAPGTPPHVVVRISAPP
ncbi:hypothetical protein [Streptomyces sp. Z423-1]|nr:hypothetical protein [Streptomyces sp. Z423-1]